MKFLERIEFSWIRVLNIWILWKKRLGVGELGQRVKRYGWILVIRLLWFDSKIKINDKEYMFGCNYGPKFNKEIKWKNGFLWVVGVLRLLDID